MGLQVKTTGPNYHTEPIHVHSPLPTETQLMYPPPLTYMLKFSRLLALTSFQMTQQQQALRHTAQVTQLGTA